MAREVFRYHSRRERNQKLRRNLNLILLFGTLAFLLWVVMKRQELLGLIKTYTY